MAQLLIKKSSWWEFNAKQAIIWLPVAAVQASTLAGLGYFYHRLNALEAQPAVPPQPLAGEYLARRCATNPYGTHQSHSTALAACASPNPRGVAGNDG